MTSLTNHAINTTINNANLVLKSPSANEITYFNEQPPNLPDPEVEKNTLTESIVYIKDKDAQDIPSEINNSPKSNLKKSNKKKRSVHFPENIIKDYSEPPKLGWIPGSYPTSDLLEAYLKSCERHKCKSINKLYQQLKALQDLDCSNGEKVNYLNLKNEKIDSRQIETLEEIFKRLSFKTIDLEHTTLEDESSLSTLFEILGYYDTVERLILSNSKTIINLLGWQELSKFIRKGTCLEYLDIRGHAFNELIYFTYIARSIKLTTTLRVIHLEQSNISGRYLLMLAAALKDNDQIKELYLADNKIQSSDGNSIATLIKENSCLEILDLRNNNIHDIGLSHICSGLSEQDSVHDGGLKALVMMNNNITANGISYLSKALIHNRSLNTLNVANNSLTNEAIFELKEALIVNKQITGLFLNKTKLTDEGIIALAEYIAETSSLNRLDLRDNDIRLGGLMALVSSLKFNNTLSRLDVDREPKKEHNFFQQITFQMKDSLETTRRLLQDLNEYCLRNQRLQAKKEAERAELARKQFEDRKKLQIENEQQLLELVKEINSQITEEDTSVENNSNSDFSTSLPEDMDEFLDNILTNTTSVESLNTNKDEESESHFDNIDQYNKSHFGQLSESFQLVDGVEEESSETDPDLVILNPDISKNTSNPIFKIEDIDEKSELSKDDFELEILSVVNSLVEKVIWESRKLEPEKVPLFHQNSSTLVFEPFNQEQILSEKEYISDSLIGNIDQFKLSNFNDSNDLSVSIEPENSQDIDEKPFFFLAQAQKSTNEQKSLIDSSIEVEDESCNDSDIEVLAVSSRFVNKIILKSVKMNNESSGQSQSNNGALLDSITEQEVRTLIENKTDNIVQNEYDTDTLKQDNSFDETNGIISNYDMINDDKKNDLESGQTTDSSIFNNELVNSTKFTKSTPIKPVNKNNQDNHTSSSDTSLILSTSPFNQFSPKFYSIDDRLSPPPDTTTTKKTSSRSNSPNGESPAKMLDLTESAILPDNSEKNGNNSEVINENVTEIDDKSINRPFFTSEMTNSQISKELSNEIGFEWD